MEDDYEGKSIFILQTSIGGDSSRGIQGGNKMGPMPKSGDDSLAPDPFDPEADRR
jgi:hypothetical protein